MNKKEFISELKSKLSILKKEEVNDIVNEYSEHIEEKIKSICKKDSSFLQKGTVFDKITVLESGFYGSMLCGPVVFLGRTKRWGMLFSSGNGWYYFTVCGGWGVEDNCLYAMSIGEIRRDFKKPVTVKDIKHGINKTKEPSGV